jgi:hypothetical protein
MSEFDIQKYLLDIPIVPPFTPGESQVIPYEPPPEPPEKPIDINAELGKLQVTVGVMIWGNKESRELIGSDEQRNLDAQTALLFILESQPNVGVLNNIGCTFMWQHSWGNARSYFERARLANQDFNGAKEQAAYNLTILNQIDPPGS